MRFVRCFKMGLMDWFMRWLIMRFMEWLKVGLMDWFMRWFIVRFMRWWWGKVMMH